MDIDNILKSTSFGALQEVDQKAVTQFNLDIAAISRSRQSIAESFAIHSERVAKTNPALFNFLKPNKKTALLQNLRLSFYVLFAQYQLDEAEHRRQNLKNLAQKIKRCVHLINDLNQSDEQTPESMLIKKSNDSEKYLKYLGLTQIAPFIAEKMIEISDGKTVVMKNWMDDINERRMYWVWGGDLLNCIFNLLPDDYAHSKQGRSVLDAPVPYLGYTSWILYYTRFGINLSLLLKHTLAGPWMSEEEKKIPMAERFKTQWDQRKFTILNDSVWATVNLVTFFWLHGRGMLGYWGDAITVGLLLFDASLTFWHFAEEETKHNETIKRYNLDLEELEKNIAKSQDETRKILQHQYRSLQKDREKIDLDWKYKKNQLSIDAAYSIALFAAFFVAATCLIPPLAILPATALMINLLGSTLCFTLTLAYVAVSGKNEIEKTQETSQLTKSQCNGLLNLFNDSQNESKKRLYYLEMQQLTAETAYQEELARFQKIKLIRSVFIDTLIPALVFVSLVFMPLGFGLGMLAVGFALAGLSKIILNQYEPHDGVEYKLDVMNNAVEMEPETLYLDEQDGKITYSVVSPTGEEIKNVETDIKSPNPFTIENLKPFKNQILNIAATKKHTQSLPGFNEQAYQAFAKNPTIAHLEQKHHRFFSPKTESTDDSDAGDLKIQLSGGGHKA